MDLDLSSLGLPVVTGACAAIAVFTVWFISKLREALYKHWKAAIKAPGWIWFALALVIPVGICLLFNLDWFQALINTSVGEGKLSVSLNGYGAIPTGIMTAIGSNGTFELLRKKGLVTTKPSSQEVNPEAKSVESSQNGNTSTQSGNEAPVPSVHSDLAPSVEAGPASPTPSSDNKVEQVTPLSTETTPTENKAWPTARPVAHLLKEVRPSDRQLYYIALDPLDGPLYPLGTPPAQVGR